MSFLKKLTKEFDGLKASLGGDDKKPQQSQPQYGQPQQQHGTLAVRIGPSRS